jgi:hypothetical protein
VKKRFRDSIRNVKTLTCANTDSDHNLLVAEVQTRLKAIKKAGKKKPKGNLERRKESRAKKIM